MALSLHHLVVDAHDLPALARFWCRVLEWRVLSEKEREVIIGPSAEAGTGICFMPVTDAKSVKNRLHFDLAPDDQEAEVARLLALGARRLDIGQGGGRSWVVLQDPEGNEFCVLKPRRNLIAFAD
ncbi:VOC family protein [Streptomyces reniochalinae]|uniref:VOC family protein n=1 Tax=Streptomyces reniochalinae TaxID=2250578 RepID=A0A367EEC2_9ACTN|nr:VOC family protein [Streptomyces reniochalinae]RCG16424.1 VOC family protein [Streptomyces reniochalinae]